MQEIVIKNVKTAEYKEENLNKLLDPQTEHQKAFEYKFAPVSSPQATEGKLIVAFFTLLPGKANFPYHYHSGLCLTHKSLNP